MQKVVGVGLEGSCLGSEKHHRQLVGGLRLSAGCRALVHRAPHGTAGRSLPSEPPAPHPCTRGRSPTPATEPREGTG